MLGCTDRAGCASSLGTPRRAYRIGYPLGPQMRNIGSTGTARGENSGTGDAGSRRDRWWAWLRRIGLTVVALVVIEYLAVPQLIRAKSDLTLLADAAPWLLAVALALETCSLASYTALTRVVLPREVRPRFADQFRIDLTGLGVSHVVPGGGASAAALRFRLMTGWGVPAVDAASTAAVQTAVAVIGLVATFAGGVVLAGPGIVAHPGYAAAGVGAIALLIVAAWGTWSMSRGSRTPHRSAHHSQPFNLAPRFLGHRVSGWVARLSRTGVETARLTARRANVLVRDPHQRVAVFGWAGGNWLFDAACLWVCLQAYGVTLHPGALLMGYGAANLMGLLPVTPGGLGVVEAVLIPALAALGGAALAPVTLGVLTWRLLEFWLPIPVSGLTYLSLKLQRRPSAPRFETSRLTESVVDQPPDTPSPRIGSTMLIYEDMSINAADGHCGKVVDVIVDPVRLRVTHLVINPAGMVSAPRLVPVTAADHDADPLALLWTRRQVDDAELVRETDFIELAAWPHQHDGWEVGVVRVLAWPYYASGHAAEGGEDWPNHTGWHDPGPDQDGGTRSLMDYDRIPAGTAEIRRESQVISRDDQVVGHVDGLVVAPDFAISHLVLDRGHLWGHREVTIPIDAVSAAKTDAVYLTLTRDEVTHLPSVRFHRHPTKR
jgi:uncharacterized membrane protein YbhN (UPF0104 family)